MGDYLLDRYGLAGHDKVSLPGIMAILRSAIPIEDVETLPFFEDMIEELQDLTPPKRFSLFFPQRAVIEAAAKTYVQASKDYYQAWCKSSSADFYDMWEPVAYGTPVVTLEGSFPWAPHVCYLERVTLHEESTSSNKLQDGDPNARATSNAGTMSRQGTVTPRKTRGLLPMDVVPLAPPEDPEEGEPAEALDIWLATKLSVTEANDHSKQDRFGYGPPSSLHFFADPNDCWVYSLEYSNNYDTEDTLSWTSTSSTVYLSAVLEVKPSAPFEGILRLADYNASATAIEAGLGSDRTHSILGLSYTPRILLRQDRMPKLPVPPKLRVRQFMIDMAAGEQTPTTTPAGTPEGSYDTRILYSVRKPYVFPVVAVGAEWCPLEPAVTAEGNAIVQFSSSAVLLQGTAKEYNSDSTTHYVARSIPEATSTPTESASSQVEVSTIASYVLQENSQTRSVPYVYTSTLQLGLPGFRDIYSTAKDNYKIFVVRQGPEAAFVRAEKLDTMVELLADATTVAELKAAANGVTGLADLEPVSFATPTAAYYGMFPIVAWRTYHIEADVYAIFIIPPDSTFQEFNNEAQSHVRISGYTEEGTRTLIATSDYEPYSSSNRGPDAYVYIWVPCSSLRGVGLSYDGPAETYTSLQEFSQHVEAGPDEPMFSGLYTPLRDRNTSSSTSDSASTSVMGHPRLAYRDAAVPQLWGTPQTFITRWLDENDEHVDLFGLLDLEVEALPTKLYGTARAPWDDPTEQELRLISADPRQPGKTSMELPGEIAKAIDILEEHDVRLTYRARSAEGGALVQFVRTVTFGTKWDIFYEYAWDPISAYAARYQDLPTGYTWLKQETGGVTEAAVLRVALVLTQGYQPLLKDLDSSRMMGKSVTGGAVHRQTPIVTYRPPPADLGNPYIYTSTDGGTLGVSTPHNQYHATWLSIGSPNMYTYLPYPGDHTGTTTVTQKTRDYYPGPPDPPPAENTMETSVDVGAVCGLWDVRTIAVSSTSGGYDFPKYADPDSYDFMDPPEKGVCLKFDATTTNAHPMDPYMSNVYAADRYDVKYTGTGPGTASWPPLDGGDAETMVPADFNS